MSTDENLDPLRRANSAHANSTPLQGDATDNIRAGDLIADGHYRIQKLLGRGASGSVYGVESMEDGQRFAMKTLNTVVSSDTTWRRFQKEVDAAMRLNHPNLVKAVEFGLLADDRPFMIMEYVEGENLAEFLKRKGKLPLAEISKIFIPLANALAFAHKEKVVHRDIKPGNVMLHRSGTGEIEPKIVDFGIARVVSESGMTLTQTADVFGTPLYMSPEQCTSAIVDHRSDIYSLGCMLFEALTGAPPFNGDNALATMMMHKNDLPPTLREASLGESFSSGWEELLAKMLAKDPKDRYQTCDAVEIRLKNLLSGNDKAEDPDFATRRRSVATSTSDKSGSITESRLNNRVLIWSSIATFVILFLLASALLVVRSSVEPKHVDDQQNSPKKE